MSSTEYFQRLHSVKNELKLSCRVHKDPSLTWFHRLLALSEFWVQAYRRRRHFRHAMQPVLAERDQILADIGYDRRDILWAISLPLRVDAQRALEIRRRMR